MNDVDESVRRFRAALDDAVTRGRRAKAQARHDRETADHDRPAVGPVAEASGAARGAGGANRAGPVEDAGWEAEETDEWELGDWGCDEWVRDSSRGETPAGANAESNSGEFSSKSQEQMLPGEGGTGVSQR